MLENLNIKDKKILIELDLNARTPISKIAKKVSLSKDAVNYRIKNLEKNNIIIGYTTIINSLKLGYTLYRVFFNLIDMTIDKYNNLILFLTSTKNVWWIAKCDGSWNFGFVIWVKNNEEFREFYNNKLLHKFKQNIKEQMISPITKYIHYSRNYIIDKSKKIELISNSKIQEYDKLDIEILKMLSINARKKIITIAEKLNVDSMTIHHRIKNLEKKGIIEGYKVNLNLNTLKIIYYSLKININDMSKLEILTNHIKTIPELTSIVESISNYDLECELEVKSTNRYFEIIEEIESKFNFIHEIIYFRVLKNYKILYMPEI